MWVPHMWNGVFKAIGNPAIRSCFWSAYTTSFVVSS